MKYVLVIGEGMADTKLAALAYHTPMEVLALNAFDRCAGCFAGRVLTVPHGMPVTGETAIRSLLGCAPQTADSEAGELPSFRDRYGHFGSVISAAAAVREIARQAGLKTPTVEGATGGFDSNYEGKVACALQTLEDGDDFAAVHVKAPDVMAHEGDLGRKLEAIQNVEYRVVMPLLNQLMGKGEDFRLLLASSHATLLTTRQHGAGPVPYAIFDSRVVRKAIHSGQTPPTRKFCEAEMLCEPVLMDGTDLIKLLFEQY